MAMQNSYPAREIVMRVSSRLAPSSFDPDVDKRLEFWKPLIDRAERMLENRSDVNAESVSIEAFESRLISGFNQRLKSYLVSLTNPSVMNPEAQRKAALAASTVINARIVGYSSLDLGISIEPIGNLVEFFDGNFDYFQIFLSSYIPKSFDESIRGGFWYTAWDSTLAEYNFAISSIPAEISDAFKSKSVNAPTVKLPSADKARWAWVLANTSLVVPTLLAAAYLYVAERRLESREQVVEAKMNIAEKSAIEAYKAVSETQAKLIESLVKKVESSSSTTPGPKTP
jgi:hypothetical protein